MSIVSQFQSHKISQLQLDPYGVCNGKCWYCPVRYVGNPIEGRESMSPELLEKIIVNLLEERERNDGLVDKRFGGFYTAHYNEILLYKNFEQLLQLCQKYRLCFMLLSNGVALSPEKVDLLIKYTGVVNGICLNIPAFEPETWNKRSGFNITLFDKLIGNINYAVSNLTDLVKSKAFSIQINGVNSNSFRDKGGWLDKGPAFPSDIDLNSSTGELIQQERLAKSLFPNVQIYSVPSLIDRAGLLDHIMTNKSAIKTNLKHGDDNRKVIRCNNGWEVGGRPIGWLHINGAGDAFLCCNDYNFNYKIGNFKTQNLRDFWGKPQHLEIIETAYKTICINCASAVFE